MSFDPQGYQDQPATPEPGGSSGPPQGASAAKERAKLPAVFLLVLGVLNLLGSLLPASIAFFGGMVPPETFAAEYQRLGKQNPGMFAEAAKQAEKQDPKDLQKQVVVVYSVIAGAVFLASLVVIFGGIRMLQMRSYALCIVASIVAAIPGVSPSCCCFGAGAAVGIWSIIVLLSDSVRREFH